MVVKTSGAGHIGLPAIPGAGTAITSGVGANTLTTTFVAFGTSTSAWYITGIVVNAAITTAVQPNYCSVVVAAGATGAEAIIDSEYIPVSYSIATVSAKLGAFTPVIPYVPVATTTRLSGKTADSAGSVPWLVWLQAIPQASVVDDGVAMSANVTQTLGGASTGAAGFVGIDWAHINAPTTTQGLTGTTISATQTVATVTGNVTGSVGSVVAGVNTTSWASGAIPSVNTTGVPIVDTRQLVRTNTAQAGGTTTSIVLDAGASATNSFYNGMVCQIISGGGAPEAGLITAYVGATKTATIAPAWTTAPGATSVFQIFPAMCDLETIAFTATKGAAGFVGIDWAQINAPTTVQGLTGTTISATQTVATVTGNVTGSVGSVVAGVNTTSIAGVASKGAGGYTGIDWAQINAPTTVQGLTGTTISATQTVATVTGNVTGSVGSVAGNVVGSVGSISGITFPTRFSVLSIDASGNVSLVSNVKKNSAQANMMFVMTDSTNHLPLTGLTVTATRSLDGAAFAATANAPTEVGGGTYVINLAATDTNANHVMLQFTATGADQLNLEIITVP